MAHVFNFHTFATLIRQIDRIIEGARDQERRLARVVSRFESVDHLSAETSMEGPTTASRGHELTTIADRDQGSVLLARLREICIHERQQRQIAEALAISLVGEVATRDAAPSGRRHVLIVDDSEDSRELAALALEGAGLDVATAANGLEGVIFAHYALPIVILMDITMPVLNGFEAARLLKASPTLTNRMSSRTRRNQSLARAHSDGSSSTSWRSPRPPIFCCERFSALSTEQCLANETSDGHSRVDHPDAENPAPLIAASEARDLTPRSLTKIFQFRARAPHAGGLGVTSDEMARACDSILNNRSGT